MQAAVLAINTDAETTRRLKNYCATAGYLFTATQPESAHPENGQSENGWLPDILIIGLSGDESSTTAGLAETDRFI